MRKTLVVLAVVTAAAAPAAGQGNYYLPAGFKLTPFLTQAPQRSFEKFEEKLAAKTDYRAVLETTAGRMVLDLYESKTPKTVASFVWLARHHYYDGINFHRVIADFMAQTGDPNTVNGARGTWGQGGPGYQYGLEVRSDLKFDAKGVLGMARTQDPNSNGSQFFITFGPTPFLDMQYTVFGKVVEGVNVLDKIAKGEPPATPTKITRAYIIEKKL